MSTEKKEAPQQMDEFRKGAWGIMWNPDYGWALLTPNERESVVVPDEALAMTAVFIRLQKSDGFLEENRDMFLNGKLPSD